VILCDTSALIAFLNRKDINHAAVKAYENLEFLIPTSVLCEVDYFLTKYVGDKEGKELFERITTNEKILFLDSTDLARVNQIRRQYNDLPLGFVDASLVALAERHRVRQILTLDRRHFLAVVP
jgi:uncharacterized protein